MKNSQLALERLFELYRRFTAPERSLADQVLVEWTLAKDEGTRFDAMALIREFGVASAIPALDQLKRRLVGSTEPGASFEIEKIDTLMVELGGDDSASR